MRILGKAPLLYARRYLSVLKSAVSQGLIPGAGKFPFSLEFEVLQ